MTKTPADRLRAARIARGYETAAEAARVFGWPEVTYTSHENGTRGLRPSVARKYALAFGIAASELLGLTKATQHFDADQKITIVGVVAWGVWRDMAVAGGITDLGEISVPNTNGSEARRALRITDDSVNQTLGPDGIAIYRPLDEDGLLQVKPGALVVVEQKQGNLCELTIRRVSSVNADHILVMPHSKNPKFTGRLKVPTNPQDENCRIVGQVVAKYEEV